MFSLNQARTQQQNVCTQKRHNKLHNMLDAEGFTTTAFTHSHTHTHTFIQMSDDFSLAFTSCFRFDTLPKDSSAGRAEKSGIEPPIL